MKIIAYFFNDALTCVWYARTALPIVLFMLACFCLIIFPLKFQAAKRAALQARLRPGVRIITLQHQIGTIIFVENNCIILQLDDGRKIEILPQAIAQVHSDCP